MLAYIREMFVYDDWANRLSLRSLVEMEHPPERAQQMQSTPVWPEFGLADCERQVDALRQVWEEYLAGLTDAALDSTIEYTNSKGERYTNAVRDVLMHVLMHGVYHRGQIAAAVRDRAGEPAYTDYIEAVRKGKLAVVSSEV
jgi:uncharacterized damage-inducible protein DinB